MDTDRWLEIWHRIDERNQVLGWERWDWGDLYSHPLVTSIGNRHLKRILLTVLRALEVVHPVLLHRAVRMPRRVIPSGFFHVGMAYLYREQLRVEHPWDRRRLDSVLEQALRLRLPVQHVAWSHPYSHHAGPWRGSSTKPPSCAHHTARLGRLLLEASLTPGRERYASDGVSAARAMIAYHNWSFYDDGTCTVSYYPDTHDETLNVAADTAALLSLIPGETQGEFKDHIEGLINTLLNEQRPDGAWNYCTSRHYERTNEPGFIDSHHTAEIVQALACVLRSESLSESRRASIQASVDRGLVFLLENFFLNNGTALLYFPGHRSKRGHIVAYSETMGAIFHTLTNCKATSSKLQELIRKKSDFITERALEHFNPKSGDVACTYIFGKYHNIQSLRWGSAPLMETIVYSLLIREIMTTC